MSPTDSPPARPALATRHFVMIGFGMVALAAVVEMTMGRVPICTCGTVRLWVGEANGPETSQQIADWYTLSHIIHGFLFFGALWLVARRLPVGARYLIALAVEIGWELLENSPLIIERYRSATAASGYSGDSVLNSVCDMLFMALGFAFAARAPVWLTVLVAIGFELLAAYVIHDNLTLNVIMLLYPIPAIRAWQGAL